MDETLRDARQRYFAESGLAPDGGIDDAWVHIKVGPFPFAYPNSKGRKRLVPFHDLHHVATGYATDLQGEAEVGAWEIGSHMKEPLGVFLGLLVMGFVVVWSPRRCFRAFVRGRHSRNLLGPGAVVPDLDRQVAELRAELGLDQELPPPTLGNRIDFATWASLSVAIVWGPLVPMAWWLAR